LPSFLDSKFAQLPFSCYLRFRKTEKGLGLIATPLDWIASRPPGLKTAQQRVHVLVALLNQFQRHTGAGAFISSSAVGDDQAVPGNRQFYVAGSQDGLGIIIGCPLDLGIIGVAADIGEIELLPLVQPLFDLLGCQSCNFSFGWGCSHGFSLLLLPPRGSRSSGKPAI
jgi:hypothetical protein